MTEKNIKLIVIVLGILIIIAFFLILYGMYTKISSNFLRKEINTENISLSLKKGDVIENFQIIDKGRILVTIKNQDQLIGLIYDINNKKIIQKLDK